MIITQTFTMANCCQNFRGNKTNKDQNDNKQANKTKNKTTKRSKAVCYIVFSICLTLGPYCPKRCVTLFFLYVSPQARTVQSGVLHCTFYMTHPKAALSKAVCYIVRST